MSINTPKIAVVVLNYCGFELTVNCIRSLEATGYSNLNIIIVDNASGDDSGNKLKAEFPEHDFIRTTINKGYAGGMNAGISHALQTDAPLIMFTNNDVSFEKDFFDPIPGIFESKPEVGLLTPKVLYLDHPDTIYCAGGDLSYLYCCGVALGKGKNINEFGHQSKYTDFAEGTCIIARRNVFARVGLISEKFFMYAEDAEFSIRANKHFKTFYCAESVMYHKVGGGLSWERYTSLYYYYYTRNRFILFQESIFPYKLYVVLFAVTNSVMKYGVLLFSSLRTKNNAANIKEKLSALLRGTAEGIKLIFSENQDTLV